MTLRPLIALSSLCLLLGCPSDPLGDGETETASGTATGQGSGSGAGPVTGSSSVGDTALDSSGSDGAGTSGSTSGTTMADGTTGDSSTGAAGCGPIDVLFVIDNSGSMMEEQTRLLSAFPSFVAGIEEQLGTSDLHVMVTDVDAWVYGPCDLEGFSYCDPPPACAGPTGECSLEGGAVCIQICTYGTVCQTQGHSCEGVPHDACDEVLGAGVDHTFGPSSSDQECEFSSGGRYIDESEPDLLGAFGCAAQVGTTSMGATERPMQSMVDALTAGSDAFACNDGFLRDEAQLVVVFITDESDDTEEDSSGDPATWHAALLNAKGGDVERISVLGLFGDGDLVRPSCTAPKDDGGAEIAPRLRAFMTLVGDRGVFGSVCDPSYEPAFGELMDVIQTSCEG